MKLRTLYESIDSIDLDLRNLLDIAGIRGKQRL